MRLETTGPPFGNLNSKIWMPKSSKIWNLNTSFLWEGGPEGSRSKRAVQSCSVAGGADPASLGPVPAHEAAAEGPAAHGGAAVGDPRLGPLRARQVRRANWQLPTATQLTRSEPDTSTDASTDSSNPLALPTDPSTHFHMARQLATDTSTHTVS
jgi:hypothetical protein